MENTNKKSTVDESLLKKIKEQIEAVQYGSITIVVHEGKVVQIDTNTKIRLN